MYKSGLIVGAVGLVFSVGLVLLSPCLVLLCLVPVLGLGGGFLSGVFDKPEDNSASTKVGAIGGAIAGAGALIGQLIGAMINSVWVGPEGNAEMVRNLGFSYNTQGSEPVYYIGVFGSGICLGGMDVLLMAGMGALGCLFWWYLIGEKKAAAVIESKSSEHLEK